MTISISSDELEALAQVRKRLANQDVFFNQSQVVRMAITFLGQAQEKELVAHAKSTPVLKPGRKKRA